VKTAADILTASYLNKSDIRKLFGVGQREAVKIYDLAFQIDKEQLGINQIYDYKVRITSACKVTGIPLSVLRRQFDTENRKAPAATGTSPGKEN